MLILFTISIVMAVVYLLIDMCPNIIMYPIFGMISYLCLYLSTGPAGFLLHMLFDETHIRYVGLLSGTYRKFWSYKALIETCITGLIFGIIAGGLSILFGFLF